MTLALTEDEFIKFLASPKFISGPLKYQKKNSNFQYAQALVRCPEYSEINIRLVTEYHITRIPRKFGVQLLCENKRTFGLDVNPGRTHTNPMTLEVVRGSHWHIYPNITRAIQDGIERTHQQWMSDFLIQTNIIIEGGYTAPTFEIENVQLNFLGGET